MQQFNWEVLTQDQILEQQDHLEPGEYDFEVSQATFKISTNNNAMMTLVLKVWNQNGDEYLCYDNLIGTAGWAYKNKKFWESVGHPELYEIGGCTEHDFVGKQGRVKTKLEKSKDGEKMYIKVASYVANKSTPVVSIAVAAIDPKKAHLADDPMMKAMDKATEAMDDDIPF